jgi:diguanylate cyclase (GGDEF)-like protein/PAS domain S-box-containing protein
MPIELHDDDCRTAKEPSGPDSVHAVTARFQDVSTLLSSLGSAAPQPPSIAETAKWPVDNQLEMVRLGVAGSLFAALRAKHAPTAKHSLRVAICCSAWGAMLEMSEAERDELEVAALLHDIGKILIPDAVLLKPAPLTADEYAVIETHRRKGPQLLQTCCASESVRQIVQYAGGWFDGSRPGYDMYGEQLPLGARVVAIADAFDAMTSDQVYRRAMSHERAVAELFDFAGTQFDARLVEAFANYVGADQIKLRALVARSWLKDLERAEGNAARPACDEAASDSAEGPLYRALLENMSDAVVLVDSSLRIMLWNQATERLTGIASASIEHSRWSSELLKLRDGQGRLIDDRACPVRETVKTGVPKPRERLSILGRGGYRIEVEAHLVPIPGKKGGFGAALMMNDASTQVTLEETVESLHQKAARDPLTQVANRAEFDKVLADYVKSHLEQRLPCSLILCDIDHFKKVNDTFGHQAGDEVLITFSALLRRHCRAGDLVARYGGEEFALLFADCCTTSAAQRADKLRMELAGISLPALGGKSITSSFGVTQIQSGDTPETMLRRADRALYQAKANGRNTVVQLGSGVEATPPPPPRGWLNWLRSTPGEKIVERSLSTSVPLNIVVQKVRGFVTDHHAQIDSIAENHVVLQIDGESSFRRRKSDAAVPFIVDMRFEESHTQSRRGDCKVARTIVNISIRPKRSRDRRHGDINDQAQRLLASFKSYLMAWDSDSAQPTPEDSQALVRS